MKNMLIGTAGIAASVTSENIQLSEIMALISQIVIAAATLYTMFKNSKKN